MALSRNAGIFATSAALIATVTAPTVLAQEVRHTTAAPARTSVTQPFTSSTTRAPQGDIKAELQRMYPAVQKDGYTYIKMDRVAPGGNEALDVTTMIGFQSKANDPTRNPLVFVNYSIDGNFPVSLQQSDIFNRALPVLAKSSKRPIVFIDAVAMRMNAQGQVENVFMANLLGDIQNNKLGPGGTPHAVEKGAYILPYGYVLTSGLGSKAYDFSFTQYENAPSPAEIKKGIARNLVAVVQQSNQELLTAAVTPSSDLTASR